MDRIRSVTRRRLAACLLLLVLSTPLLPAVPAGDAPMACCVTEGSCECRTPAGFSRCPSESSVLAPQRLPGVISERVAIPPPAARPLPLPLESIGRLFLVDEPPVPPPRRA